jgi:sugar lactone lactonase YvrE
MKTILKGILVLIAVLLIYLLAMPVPVAPVAWKSPPNPGYSGVFVVNNRLDGIETLGIGNKKGPEDITLDKDGRIYAATHDGTIVRLQADGTGAENWVNTGGRPLGIDFDAAGNLIVADAYRGLLAIDTAGQITVLANEANGIAIRYTDDVDVAADGKIYFSDASTKFQARENGGTYEASLLDLMEHGGYGRLLVHDPATGKTDTLLDGLNFANGVAVSPDQQFVLVNETGEYRVVRYWIAGPRQGQHEQFGPIFPAFPDNISTGLNGKYWVALVSPRSKPLDDLSEKPFLRKIVQRLPAAIRPKAIPYGHIIALDGEGNVVEDLQDPEAGYPVNTSITETEEYLYIGSLFTPVMGRLLKVKAGL